MSAPFPFAVDAFMRADFKTQAQPGLRFETYGVTCIYLGPEFPVLIFDKGLDQLPTTMDWGEGQGLGAIPLDYDKPYLLDDAGEAMRRAAEWVKLVVHRDG
jgi:hypothetical protein